MAPPSTEEKSVVQPIVSQMNNIFSFYLSKGAGSVGNLKFGSYDLEKYAKTGTKENDIKWINVVDEGWTIPLNGARFSKSQEKLDLKAEQITLDTGLSYALVPPPDIETLVETIKAGKNFTC